MEKLLTMDGNMNLLVDPYAISIPEYKALVDKDVSKRKEVSKQEFAYLWFLFETADKRNPYKEYNYEERKEHLRKDIMPKGWKATKEFANAVKRYKAHNYTRMKALLDSSRTAADKLRGYFDTVDLLEVDENGKLRFSSKDLVANISNLGKVMDGLKKLEEIVKKEEEHDDSQIRGGGQLGLIESGSIGVDEHGNFK